MDSAVNVVHGLINGWAAGFSWSCRKKPTKPGDAMRSDNLTIGKQGLQEDEARAFLRTYRAGLVVVNPDGSFFLPGERSGKETLHLVGRSGDAVALHIEYLIQIGAYGELVLDHGWPTASLSFEMDQFDIMGHASVGTSVERPVLLVEAKARADGGDSLASLRDSMLGLCHDQAHIISNNNHRRKAEALAESSITGPVLLWLVCSGARWLFHVDSSGGKTVIMERDGEHPVHGFLA